MIPLRESVMLLLANATDPSPCFDTVDNNNRMYLEQNYGLAATRLLACYELTERNNT